jgi:hydroxymethylglutaryl-CoA lyase
MNKIKLIESPRDALQGRSRFVPTEDKVAYYENLLKVGFHTLDCGSFVSPKRIPQMSDTFKVIEKIDTSESKTKILVIVANERGAIEALKYSSIDILGYPFSISENFQIRNTSKTLDDAFDDLKKIIELANKKSKEVITYLSMGFGNPYGDPWNISMISEWIYKLTSIGVKTISFSDTDGMANKRDILVLYKSLTSDFSKIEFGAHFHTHPDHWFDKVNSAYLGGCRRFDGTIMGWGGCPMASDSLIGNMPTEKLITYFNSIHIELEINSLAFESSYNIFRSLMKI